MRNINEDTSPVSLHIKVFREIENAILDGSLKRNEALTEARLCGELGVSRTPVREALRQLELEGLVKTVPNKGAVVVGFTQKDIEDIYTIRMYIEGLAARWAAENIKDESKKALTEITHLQEFYLDKGDNLQIWLLDSRFHEVIYNACGSRPLKQILTQSHNFIQKSREISIKSEGRAEAAVNEHRLILNAILAGKPDESELLAKQHIQNAKISMLSLTAKNINEI